MDHEELFKNDWESIAYSNSLGLKLEIVNRKIRELGFTKRIYGKSDGDVRKRKVGKVF